MITITEATYMDGSTLSYVCNENYITFDPVLTMCQSPSFTWSLDGSAPICRRSEYFSSRFNCSIFYQWFLQITACFGIQNNFNYTGLIRTKRVVGPIPCHNAILWNHFYSQHNQIRRHNRNQKRKFSCKIANSEINAFVLMSKIIEYCIFWWFKTW